MSARPTVVVIGDVVLDRDLSGQSTRLSPDAPVPVVDVEATCERPGGAGLAARLCAGDGADVVLVAPIAADADGRLVARMLRDEMTLLPLPHEGPTRRKTRVLSRSQVVIRMDDGGPGTPLRPPLGAVRQLLSGADAVLVSDYGAGTTRHAGLRRLIEDAARRVPVVWDPHPRGGEPVAGVFATPNLGEARAAGVRAGLEPELSADVLVGSLGEVWRARAVCVTAGDSGAYLAIPGAEPVCVPAPLTATSDTCGAGDRFAAAAIVRLAVGDEPLAAFTSAVAQASAWVAGGGVSSGGRHGEAASDAGALLPRTAGAVVDQVRATGGTVVATGGCFDVLHAGHVACLQAARRLGDSLVVLINSDESVRRLKGSGRPVVSAADRAEVLLALSCVDAVEVFDAADPRDALGRLRPDVWVKGADYAGTALPEAQLIRSWGGRIVLVPYLTGRSSTSILRRSTGSWEPDFQEAS
jgi:D-beta-D-heptose 7-phosphate kinase / D-beta-D-heptose 1-phosphate adenosyltransferase